MLIVRAWRPAMREGSHGEDTFEQERIENMGSETTTDPHSAMEIKGRGGSIYRTTSLMQLQRDFPWLYYNALEDGYKYKICELFPESVVGVRGKNKFKFGSMAVKSLSDHPNRILSTHASSEKHRYSKG